MTVFKKSFIAGHNHYNSGHYIQYKERSEGSGRERVNVCVLCVCVCERERESTGESGRRRRGGKCCFKIFRVYLAAKKHRLMAERREMSIENYTAIQKAKVISLPMFLNADVIQSF